MVYWKSTTGYTAAWALNTSGVRSAAALVSATPLATPAEWILGGAADINGDGRAELFWCPTNATMRTWFLDANYQFESSAILYGSQCPTDYQLRAVGDCNGDGKTDLIFQDIYFGYIDTWFLESTGELHVAVPTYPGSIPSALQLRCAGDVNSDGRVELFFQNTSTGATEVWFLYGGDPYAQPVPTPNPGSQELVRAVHSTPVPAGWTLRACGDVNNDGRVELFWQHTTGTTATWFLNSAGERTSAVLMHSAPVPAGWTMKGAVDVDADGKPEILWLNTTTGQTATWFLGVNGVRTISRLMHSTPVSPDWSMAALSGVSAPP